MEFFQSPLTFHSANRAQRKLNPSPRFLAAEIEVASVSDGGPVSRVVRKWNGQIVTDGSLPSGGFEINTAPAGGDKWVQQVNEICRALNDHDAKVTDACGLHVHIDARDVDYYGIRRLIRLYARLENLLFQMVPKARRDSTYCTPCGAHYQAFIDGVGTVKTVLGKGLPTYKDARKASAIAVYNRRSTDGRTNKYNGARYRALNLHSWFHRGTIECRLFTGSTNAAKIRCWGIMWALIVDKAAKSTEAEIDAFLAFDTSYDLLCKIVAVGPPEVRAFIDNRLDAYADQITKDFVAGNVDGERMREHERTVETRAMETHNQSAANTIASIDRQQASDDRMRAESAQRRRRERREERERERRMIAARAAWSAEFAANRERYTAAIREYAMHYRVCDCDDDIAWANTRFGTLPFDDVSRWLDRAGITFNPATQNSATNGAERSR